MIALLGCAFILGVYSAAWALEPYDRVVTNPRYDDVLFAVVWLLALAVVGV